ncbi:MAG TPA: ubiquinol-cytochrome c reductase cytochrome b subunit [Nocardioidaceae bacterium]|jgi:ubiquinol-cytochrome c reductase cytochrome b subunit|nr:ubiquinol-cytochrome c reductase cytochrome b subunit [Nocardioidaceae bacterium]
MSRRHPVTGTLRKVDDRLEIASVAKTAMAKVFPDHWTFMLGEIAFYSFLILVATGVYLAIFFDPSSSETIYKGSYTPVSGHEVSAAYASTLELSWDVRGGLLMRQAHHWAAHIFIGAIVLHLCRIFFTGMFRKPRELNWTVGVTLLGLAMFNAFAGYSLPDDLLSGIGLHIFYSVALSVPVIGGWVALFAFGGDFPGDAIIYRLYALHILVVPALIFLLITVHLGILIRQKHSQFAGPGRSNANVVGSRAWPGYALRSFALLSLVAAVTFLAGGFAQINPIWVWGDFNSATVLSPSVADWYVAWIEGALRLFPPVQVWIFGNLIPEQFWAGALLPLLTFVLLYLWPFLDRVITKDRGTHHLAASPRESPVRVAIGVAALTFYGILLIAGAEELISEWSRWPVGFIRDLLRVAVLAMPVVTGTIAYVVARTLKRSGKEGVLFLSWRDFRPSRTREETTEPATGETFPEPTWSDPTVPGSAVAGEAFREEPVPGPPLVLDGAEQEEERSLSEVPTWLKRSKTKGQR